MRGRSLTSVLAMLALVGTAACGAGQTAQDPSGGGENADGESGDSLGIGFTAEPASLDFTQDDGAAIPQALLVNVYEGLVKLDENGEIVPLLATDWKINKDRTIYTFTLQEDVEFSNGEPFTADDAVFSINRVKNDWKPAIKSAMDVVEDVDAVDETTVKVTLSQPSNFWLYRMTTRVGAMFDENSVDNLATEPVGTGPYTVNDWTKGDSLTLERRGDYWGEAPDVDEVEFQYFDDPTAMNNSLRSGGIDVISNVQTPESLSQFEDESKYNIIEGTTNGEVVLSMNNAKKPFDDKRVRQAIRYGIDHEALVETAWAGHGELIGSMVPPTDPWYEDLTDLYPYDPKKAKQLLTSAGYKSGDLNLRMRIPSPLPYVDNSAQVVKSQLAEIGVNVKIEPLEFPDRWLEEVFTNADYDMSIISHVEPWDIMSWGNPDYYWKYDSKEFQDLIAEADAAPTAEEQAEKMKEAARLLSEDAAGDFLFLLPNLMVTTTEVEGLPKNIVSESFDITTISVS